MSNNNDDFSDFDQLCNSEDLSDSDCNFDFDNDFNLDNFQDGKDDALTTHCQIFILENNLPDDTDPQFLRQRVWRAIGFKERMKLNFKGIRP